MYGDLNRLRGTIDCLFDGERLIKCLSKVFHGNVGKMNATLNFVAQTCFNSFDTRK